MRPDVLELDASFHTLHLDFHAQMHDVDAIRLLLTGNSVIDWRKLSFESLDQVNRFLETLLLDVHDIQDQRRVRYVYNEAVSYLEEHLKLRFPQEIRNPTDVRQVFLWASAMEGSRRRQLLSCIILKLMHVIHHMEAAELKFRAPVSEHQLLELAKERVFIAAEKMRGAGVPIVSFYGSQKSRSAVITKLLAKPQSVATTVFDKLRFRIVVPRREDLAPTLGYLTRHVVPFNYTIPQQSLNTLLAVDDLMAELGEEDKPHLEAEPDILHHSPNDFSGASYRSINFIVDFPVKVPDPSLENLSYELGRTLFVLVEFQLIDEETASLNEQGENAHYLYKSRQHQTIARRLKSGSPPPADPQSNAQES
jgi:uncharacterized protein (TIGR04552 family)